MTITLEKVQEVQPDAKGFMELYKWGDEFIVVSTVAEIHDSPQNMTEAAIVGMVGALGGYATTGEETMAFYADENGEVTDWTELAVANGDDSRERVLEMLRSGETNERIE